jgi:tetratricopeptide (TPR) repeat protein
MKAIVKKSLCAAAFVLAVTGHSFGQATQANIDPDADFKLAKELYQREQFSLAYPLFRDIAFVNSPNSKLPVSTQVEAKYYTIVCGLKLDESTSEAEAKEFIETEHNEPRIQMLSYQLGEYYYRQQKFTEALSYYEKVGIDNLSNREIAEMKFHQAYSYFTLEQFDKAKPLFNSIRQITSDPNYLDANYYFGFISFYEKNYDLALESFRRVENQATYQKVVPYYIAEILYFSGDKDKAMLMEKRS